MQQIIRVHADAPLKPAPGDACNGCGVCCLAEPCPVGVLVSGRRHGACAALHWDEAGTRYRCGVLGAGSAASGPAKWWQAAAARLIAAGKGCDSDARIEDAGAEDD
jgi:hypothetical protein